MDRQKEGGISPLILQIGIRPILQEQCNCSRNQIILSKKFRERSPSHGVRRIWICFVLEQHLHYLRVRNPKERRFPFLVPHIGIRPRIEQNFDHVAPDSALRRMQRSRAVGIFRVYLSLPLQQ